MLTRCFTIFIVILILLFSACTIQNGNSQMNNKDQVKDLLISFEELQLEDYKKAYNINDDDINPIIKNAKRVGKIKFDEDIIEYGKIEAGEKVLLDIFNNTYLIVITSVDKNEMLSLKGHIIDRPNDVFLLTAIKGEILASLEIIEKRVLYSFIDNPQSNESYIFKNSIDDIDQLECGGVIMSEESEMQNDDENIQAKNDIDSNNNKDDEKLPVNDTLTLVLDLVEVSREEYITKYGQESLIEDPVSAAASRIGKVVLNEEALKDGVLKTGSRLLFKSFDGNSYIILIESVLKGDLTSYAGSIIDPQQGFFSLSASNNKALMSIEMPGKNTMYLIKYNHVSGLHYLFKAPMDKVDFLPD